MWGRGEPASAGSGSFAEQLNLKLKHSPWLGFFAFIGSLTLIAFLIIWLRPVIMHAARDGDISDVYVPRRCYSAERVFR